MPSRPPVFGQKPKPTQRREYDRRRGSAHRRGYTGEWSAASADYRRNNPLCIGCFAVGRYEAATVTDHIVKHDGDHQLFWDRDNWQASCKWHHDVVKQRLEDMAARGQVGRPALRLDSADAVRLTRMLADFG